MIVFNTVIDVVQRDVAMIDVTHIVMSAADGTVMIIVVVTIIVVVMSIVAALDHLVVIALDHLLVVALALVLLVVVDSRNKTFFHFRKKAHSKPCGYLFLFYVFGY